MPHYRVKITLDRGLWWTYNLSVMGIVISIGIGYGLMMWWNWRLQGRIRALEDRPIEALVVPSVNAPPTPPPASSPGYTITDAQQAQAEHRQLSQVSREQRYRQAGTRQRPPAEYR